MSTTPAPMLGTTGRQQSVFIRPTDQGAAMSWGQRVQARWQGGSNNNNNHQSSNNNDVESQPNATPKATQYCLQSQASSSSSPGRHFNLAMYLHWMFRVNFGVLFSIMCAMFFTLVILFSAFIAAAGTIDKKCVRVGGAAFGEQGTGFADAFSLSWTTFSTVGYGSTYPALGYQNDSPTNCFFINFICSLESLIGVLYAGFCGAILFGKVLRIQSHAQVIFSDPMVIRYGTGVTGDGDDDDDHRPQTTTAGDEPPQANQQPCPVLEFRIVNRLFNEVGGEIMDATLNVVANVDAVDASTELATSSSVAFSQGSTTDDDNSSFSPSMASSADDSHHRHHLSKFLLDLHPLRMHRRTVVEDQSTAHLVTKHVFSKMSVEAGDHPFFKRVWLVRHVLDENSPIVKPRIRRQIRKNGGAWPTSIQTYQDVRNSLKFNQILVSLNGVSNVSASDVYAQKIYDFVDMNVGYQFVNILYRDSDESLGVDVSSSHEELPLH
jgi:hypothetical protein